MHLHKTPVTDGFIIMVQNPLWINLIILFCSLMFLLPLGLANRLNKLIYSKDHLIKLQGFINQWYEKNVSEVNEACPTKQQITSEEKILEPVVCDFTTASKPSEDYQDKYDEIWSNYDHEKK